MAVRVSPQSGSDKWKTRTTAAVPDYVAGINNVQEAPGKKAAQKSQKWIQAVTASQDKWTRNVGAVSLEQWRKITLDVGSTRIAAGVSAKQDKYTEFATKFYPYLNQGIQKVQAMPDVSFEDRLNKMVAMARHSHDFKRS